MSEIDSLLEELYPGQKKPAAAAPAPAAAPKPAPPTKHGFDDSDEEDAKPPPAPPPQQRPAVAGSYSAGTATTTTMPGVSSTSTPLGGSGGGFSTPVVVPGARLSTVRWPTLPPTLAPGMNCAGSLTLTNCASDGDMREVDRLLHLNSTQLANPKVCRPERTGQDDDGGRWCPYLRCRHCDHVVVRLQGAYWARGAVAPKGGSPVQKAPPSTTTASATSTTTAEPAKKLKVSHSFDDSSDEDTDTAAPQASSPVPVPASAPAAATTTSQDGLQPRSDDATYIVVRTHYPDWTAFPPDVLIRLPSERAHEAAAYCCQCTWASVVEPTVKVDVPIVAGGPPTRLPEQPAAARFTAPELCSRCVGVQWVCKGHVHA